VEHWSVVLPILVTECGLSVPPSHAAVQQWVFDSGNTGEAFAWRQHLLAVGLDSNVQRARGLIALTSAVGGKEYLPIRQADLWLVSNLAVFSGTPWRLPLQHGIPFRDVPTRPDPHYHRPLIGMRTLRRAGLKVELDFAHGSVSVWTPDNSG
jgi:hypothetical protein